MGAKTMKVLWGMIFIWSIFDKAEGILASDKIDWLLLHGLKLRKGTKYQTGGEDASDHAFLYMDLDLDR